MTAAAGDALSQVLFKWRLRLRPESSDANPARQIWVAIVGPRRLAVHDPHNVAAVLHGSHDRPAGTAASPNNTVLAITCAKLVTIDDDFACKYIKVQK